MSGDLICRDRRGGGAARVGPKVASAFLDGRRRNACNRNARCRVERGQITTLAGLMIVQSRTVRLLNFESQLLALSRSHKPRVGGRMPARSRGLVGEVLRGEPVEQIGRRLSLLRFAFGSTRPRRCRRPVSCKKRARRGATGDRRDTRRDDCWVTSIGGAEQEKAGSKVCSTNINPCSSSSSRTAAVARSPSARSVVAASSPAAALSRLASSIVRVGGGCSCGWWWRC